uniref:Uncharacterized protein n=1 Tax=Tolypothrix bouteillei VB521301 TaxID=1479485 RepID=A0A0C1QMA9_9CYAN
MLSVRSLLLRRRRVRPVGEDVGLLNDIRIGGRLATRDAVDVLHPFDDVAPQRVLAGEAAAAVAEADEELAVGAVRVAGAGGADAAPLIDFLAEFRRQIPILGAARAGTRRVTRLRHEAVDHAVPLDAVVEALAGELFHPLDVLRRQVGAHGDEHPAGFK